eukprot:2444429-Prymnesium_polylepis.1
MARVCPRTVRMLGNHVFPPYRLPMAHVCPRTVRMLGNHVSSQEHSVVAHRTVPPPVYLTL